MESLFVLLALFSSLHLFVGSTNAKLPGMLFPRDSESREVKDLSGFWNFRADMSENRNAGFEQSWFAKPLWQVRNLNYFPYSLQQPRFATSPKQFTKICPFTMWEYVKFHIRNHQVMSQSAVRLAHVYVGLIVKQTKYEK